MPDTQPSKAAYDQRITGKESAVSADEARRIVRAEMVRRGFTFKELAAELNARADGPPESVQTLINKVNRGRFSFAFALRVLRAMGVSSVRLDNEQQLSPPHPRLEAKLNEHP